MKSFKDREDVFNLFNSFELPTFAITTECEVSNYFSYCREHKISQFQFFLYHVCRASFEIENFRFRLFNDEVVMIDKLYPSHTVLREGNRLNFATFEYCQDFAEFCIRNQQAKETASVSTKIFEDDPSHNSYLYISCLPWFKFTAIQQPVARSKDCSIPTVVWGRITEVGDKIQVPISIQAHHGFVDGYHIHLFLRAMEHNIRQHLQG